MRLESLFAKTKAHGMAGLQTLVIAAGPMKILFYLPSYGKGGAATTQHWTELAEHLSRKHIVSVHTFASGIPHGGCMLNGVLVLNLGGRVFSKITNRHYRELLMWVLMFWNALACTIKYDVIFCVDTPKFSTLVGFIHRIRHNSKVLAWVKDLPLEQIARRSNSKMVICLANFLSRLSSRLLLLADYVLPIGECMSMVLQAHGVQNHKIHVIGDWAHDHGQSKLTSPTARKLSNLPELFTIMYLGFAAPWHDFDSIVEAIPQLVSKYPIQFVFIGNGPGIDRVARAKLNWNWENVVIIGWIPREELKRIPMCGDIHIASLKQNMLGTCAPSKTYTSMSFCRPTIFVGPPDCQAARDIKRAKAGVIVQDSKQFVLSAEKFFLDSRYLDECSQNARTAFLANHSAKIIFKKWDEFLEQSTVERLG